MDKPKRKRKRNRKKKDLPIRPLLDRVTRDHPLPKKSKMSEPTISSDSCISQSQCQSNQEKQGSLVRLKKRKKRRNRTTNDEADSVLTEPENLASETRRNDKDFITSFSDSDHKEPSCQSSSVIMFKQESPENKNNNFMPKCQRGISKNRTVGKTHSLKERLKSKLESGRFRWINEKLYTTSSQCASELFEENPDLFRVYHQGFSSQVQKWPVNPVDIMIKWIKKRSPELIIVDMGCGEAKISQSVPNKVYSFDLVAANKFVTACDMAKVPLPNKSVDVVIYCLSLMGTNLNDFLKEAYRILKKGGVMKVAEVVSRFDDMKKFEEAVSYIGFSLQNKDTTNKMFIQFEFSKSAKKFCPLKTSSVSLKPCLYKKR